MTAVSRPVASFLVPEAEISPFPDKTRVRVTSMMSGVPEGTAGTVRGTVGLALPRHRVDFDNGRFVTSVARTRLVREDEWDDVLAAREEAAAAAKDETAAAPAESAAPQGAAEAAPPADDRLAALLARSKAAREKATDG
jgi:hypothetical protein